MGVAGEEESVCAKIKFPQQLGLDEIAPRADRTLLVGLGELVVCMSNQVNKLDSWESNSSLSGELWPSEV